MFASRVRSFSSDYLSVDPNRLSVNCIGVVGFSALLPEDAVTLNFPPPSVSFRRPPEYSDEFSCFREQYSILNANFPPLFSTELVTHRCLAIPNDNFSRFVGLCSLSLLVGDAVAFEFPVNRVLRWGCPLDSD